MSVANPKSRFNVIFTYTSIRQQTIDVFLAEKGLSADDFLKNLLIGAGFSVEELTQLLKISVCQILEAGERNEPWLYQDGGKFYFAETVSNPRGARWRQIRDERIAALQPTERSG